VKNYPFYILWRCLLCILFVLITNKSSAGIDKFEKIIRFENYRFHVTSSDWGAVRELNIKVFRGNELLVNIKQKTDGFIANAELGDLDRDGSPEIYVYTSTYGSGVFGKVIGYEFFPKSFDVIKTEQLTASQLVGYMGHDSFKIENFNLVRKFPIYKSGDANFKPTGGTRTILYQLRYKGNELYLRTNQ
jgi:hypothetical protein